MGTNSPSQSSSSTLGGHTQSPTSSNHGTPASSTTALNDIRNKPLPPGENGPAGSAHGPSVSAAPQPGMPSSLLPGQPTLPSQPSVARMNSPAGNGGPGTPTRQGQLVAPSVIISPSAPVSALSSAYLQLYNAGRVVLRTSGHAGVLNSQAIS